MRIGYARVSTLDQNPELQLEKLREAGCWSFTCTEQSSSNYDRALSANFLARRIGAIRTGTQPANPAASLIPPARGDGAARASPSPTLYRPLNHPV
jgi:hypothetical protein